ncbi:MAG TPA: Gfo/Idh/MocA family oxidoreductase [Solirubrobacterales bacterium]|nr:Gfo/Idh/MocA family oxidoreductase [Solirubrobacterales bacterium]
MMRIGIAGCGRITERGYIPAVRALPDARIVALADPDAERLRHCRELCGRGPEEAAAFTDARELLAAEAIDLLVIATPAASHAGLAAEAAAVGVPALVEKPPAPDLAGAQLLAALDPEPLLAFNRRFLQGAEVLPAVPAQGWLELDLELRFRRGGWGAHEAHDEALLDAGIHLIDLACHLSGADPIAVRGASISPERAAFELELSRGRARIGCATDRGHREAVLVRERAGKVLANWVWGGIRGRLKGRGDEDPLLRSLQRQLVAAQGRLGGTESVIATAADGIRAMAIVEAARRSAELGGAEVTVAPLAEAPR